MLNSVPVGDDPTKWEFGGSTIIVVAESKDEVLDMLRRDIYTESGVWDVEKVGLPSLHDPLIEYALGDEPETNMSVGIGANMACKYRHPRTFSLLPHVILMENPPCRHRLTKTTAQTRLPSPVEKYPRAAG